MESPITTIIFDFGNVFVNWDARNLYKRFFPTLEAVDSFLEEIHFADWNAHQDAGRPFKEGVAELSKQFPQYAELIQAYDTHWMDSITETLHETIQIARNLKKSGWPLPGAWHTPAADQPGYPAQPNCVGCAPPPPTATAHPGSANGPWLRS